jgi:hypothetical protein
LKLAYTICSDYRGTVQIAVAAGADLQFQWRQPGGGIPMVAGSKGPCVTSPDVFPVTKSEGEVKDYPICAGLRVGWRVTSFGTGSFLFPLEHSCVLLKNS